MDYFKMFNKQFFLDKIESEIDEQLAVIEECENQCDKINYVLQNKSSEYSERDIEKIKRNRIKLWEKSKVARNRIDKLRNEYKRYQEMDI